jgi:hypothetical protein
VRGALLSGSGHDRLLAVTQISIDVFFRHLFLPEEWVAGREDSSEDGNLHRVQWAKVPYKFLTQETFAVFRCVRESLGFR